jgi:hypothetical protein
MATHWDDLELLRLIDHHETNEIAVLGSGYSLIQAMAKEQTIDWRHDAKTFVRELLLAKDAGYVEWTDLLEPEHVRQTHATNEADQWLQQISNIRLTLAGRDRARGRVVLQPPPDPDEDDGRQITSLTLEYVAKSITRQLDQFQVAQLTLEGGISGQHHFPEHEGSFTDRLSLYLFTLLQGASGHRRELRHFVGAWLDDRLYVGPSDDERERTESLLQRQGWFVKDGRLVVGEPVRKRRDTSTPAPKLDGLHQTIWTAAAPRWSSGDRHGAVLAAAKAVNAMLQSKLHRKDVSEVKLVQEAFGAANPKPNRPRLRFRMIEDDKTRESLTQGALSFGVGCFQAIRHPIGHRPDHEYEMTEQEALEQLAAWSLVARWIERAEVERAAP